MKKGFRIIYLKFRGTKMKIRCPTIANKQIIFYCTICSWEGVLSKLGNKISCSSVTVKQSEIPNEQDMISFYIQNVYFESFCKPILRKAKTRLKVRKWWFPVVEKLAFSFIVVRHGSAKFERKVNFFFHSEQILKWFYEC